jgi:hypothetical protein
MNKLLSLGIAATDCAAFFGTTAPQVGENKVKEHLKSSGAPAAALVALVCLAMATPAAAADYCRQDAISGMRSCGYNTIEQCQAMSSGIGGTCYRDPFLPAASSAFAYQPKQSHSKRASKPIANQ